MHVFIDTNILLNFYHFTNDDLDALNSVFVSNNQGAVIVHLTDQVKDEFWRNREAKIVDALNKMKGVSLAAQFPYFIKGYEEYQSLLELANQFKRKYSDVTRRVYQDIKSNNLRADHLIEQIFNRSTAIPTTQDIYSIAKMRIDIGNPPGKNGSIGDAINWLLLLKAVPDDEDLYLISEDSDFYSKVNTDDLNPFLVHEWSARKSSRLIGYKSLNKFVEDHYDGVSLSFDPEKKALIDELETCGSFAATHALVARLSHYQYFSLEEAKAILDAADINNQFGWIVPDTDVAEFIRMAALPHRSRLTKESHKGTLETALAELEESMG
ncbi:PIN domain-containing protein [Thiobaca trueperi]|uniref:DUF4935 domain-containing protein n=1 Tax=Thiobaca trueperi TaxID=127458 RepID=A0A4R3N5V5_9GAMM|nr:PIN domain-containing protein [Thiobaca trueperi]TCT22189.1 hypothetical protein EDC35_103288 [Thiobaca trueperi]